jgi:hypothetical protein
MLTYDAGVREPHRSNNKSELETSVARGRVVTDSLHTPKIAGRVCNTIERAARFSGVPPLRHQIVEARNRASKLCNGGDIAPPEFGAYKWRIG